ncbi:MAG: hypothetical protein ACT4O9_16525 [Blastocatellia bacterium]
MKLMKFSVLFFSIFFAAVSSNAQKTEITVSLNEQFFDTVIDALFQGGEPPEFSIAKKDFNRRDTETQSILFAEPQFAKAAYQIEPMLFSSSESQRLGGRKSECRETIRLRREMNGVRTSVRFRDGKILAPLAFNGSYNPPLVGCVGFSGWAEAVIDLEFDQNNQRLIAKARVSNVNLSGTGGVGGSIIARMVQSSIDKKINPIEIIRADKLSFLVPIQNSNTLKMKAIGIRHEILNGSLNVHIAFEFQKT